MKVAVVKPPLLPVAGKFAAEAAATEGDDGIGAADCPKHAGLFEPGTDYGFAASFNHTGTDKQVLLTEIGIAHPISVAVEVFGLIGEGLSHFRAFVGIR
jgi:hypothetical protein